MLPSWINQRLKDLDSNIQQDLELFNDFEEELRYEGNPRTKGGYRREIERQKKSIAKYQEEYNELKEQLSDQEESFTLIKKIPHKLEQMDSKINGSSRLTMAN